VEDKIEEKMMKKWNGVCMMNTHQALTTEIIRFREWAASYPYAESCGKWECDYEHWNDFYRAFSDFVTTSSQQEWTPVTIEMLLYAIARDNEGEWLIKKVAKNLDNLVFLAEQAIHSKERDAKWQFAVELSRLNQPTAQIESLQLQFAHDDNEYVRRRAMTALADLGSAHVADLIQPAWDSGDEYERIAVLYSLWKIGSWQLDDYLVQAETDGRQYLTNLAAWIRSGDPDHY
jgi:hypothetical protein